MLTSGPLQRLHMRLHGCCDVCMTTVCRLQVTVISRGRPADLPEEQYGGCVFHHVDGSTTMASSYADAGLASADAVIIGV